MVAVILSIVFLAQADTYKLTDFRLPESGAMELWLGFDADFGGSENTSGDETFRKESSASRDGSGDVNFSFFKRNERNDLSFYFTSSLEGGSESSENTTYRVSPIVYEIDVDGYTIGDTVAYQFDLESLSGSLGKNLSEELSVSEDWMYYPFKKIFFFGIGSNLSFGHGTNKAYGRSDNYLDQNPSQTDTSRSNSLGVGLTIYPLLGFGRLRELEFPSRAFAVKDILVEELGFEENPEFVRELAGLYARRWEYPIKYWHSEWEFYTDVEELLAEYGIPPEDMRIRHWMRIIESASIWSEGRPYGLRFTFRPSIVTDFSRSQSEHTFYEGYTVYSGVKNYSQTSGIFIIPGDLMLEGGYPLTDVIHLEGSVRFSPELYYDKEKVYIKEQRRAYYFDTLLVRITDTTVTDSQLTLEEYNLNYSMEMKYYMLYNIDLSLRFSGGLGRNEDYYEEGIFYKSWSNGISVGGNYYFRNRFVFSLSGSLSRSRSESSYRFDSVKTTPSASFGVSYRLF
ncbi:hypothetical protein JXM67_00480 [candidate division WOR-3 bacterium]|nr:hypothetical protein [candidate division WOR-3 bacterium]